MINVIHFLRIFQRNCRKIRNLIWLTSDSMPNTRTLCRTFVSNKLQQGNFQLVEPCPRVSLEKWIGRWTRKNRPVPSYKTVFSPLFLMKQPPTVKLPYLVRILHARDSIGKLQVIIRNYKDNIISLVNEFRERMD